MNGKGHKRRRPEDEFADIATRKLVDEGQLVQGGFAAFLSVNRAQEMDPATRDKLRDVFFAGAQHAFGSMMSFMSADEEPTEKDIQRMAALDAELRRWIEEFKAKRAGQVGKA